MFNNVLGNNSSWCHINEKIIGYLNESRYSVYMMSYDNIILFKNYTMNFFTTTTNLATRFDIVYDDMSRYEPQYIITSTDNSCKFKIIMSKNKVSLITQSKINNMDVSINYDIDLDFNFDSEYDKYSSHKTKFSCTEINHSYDYYGVCYENDSVDIFDDSLLTKQMLLYLNKLFLNIEKFVSSNSILSYKNTQIFLKTMYLCKQRMFDEKYLFLLLSK